MAGELRCTEPATTHHEVATDVQDVVTLSPDPREGSETLRTAFELVRWSADREPNGTALLDPESEEQLSYADLMRRIEVVAGEVAAGGATPGSLVATAMPNTVEHVIVLLALNRVGAVPAIINPRLKTSEINQLIARGDIEGFVQVTEQPEVGDGDGDGDGDGVEGVQRIYVSSEALRGQRDPSVPDPPAFRRPSGESPAFVFYTSGTTGLPKGVVIPNRAVEPRVLFMSTQCGLRFGAFNTALGLMPVHHVIGFFGVLLTSLAFNGTWIPVRAFDPEKSIGYIANFGVTCLFASPTHYDALLASPGFRPGCFSSVTNLIFAGSAMNESILHRLNAQVEVPIVNIYGTTETMNSLYSADAVNEPRLRAGYHSRVQIAGVAEDPSIGLPPGVEGELVVDAAADATFVEYLNNQEATKSRLVNGWYRTGDSAFTDADGYVVLTGRIDDMINTGAENVHAEEVEAVLARHPAVAEVAVVGLPDVRWGEVVTAVVVVNASVSSQELDRLCLESELANFKRPRRYFLVDQLPRNSAMKIAGHVLRDQLSKESGQPSPDGFVQVAIEESL